MKNFVLFFSFLLLLACNSKTSVVPQGQSDCLVFVQDSVPLTFDAFYASNKNTKFTCKLNEGSNVAKISITHCGKNAVVNLEGREDILKHRNAPWQTYYVYEFEQVGVRCRLLVEHNKSRCHIKIY